VARVPRWAAATLAETIERMLEYIDPPLTWSVRGGAPAEAEYDLALVVGSGPNMPKAVYVGSDGWLAEFSPSRPLRMGEKKNPVGAFAAAVIGVSEVWKRILVGQAHLFPHLPILPTTVDLVFSTFDYGQSRDAPNPPLPEEVDLEALTIAGLGAGGMACLFTLTSLEAIRGRFTQIEPDHVTDTNLNRLVVAGAADAGDSPEDSTTKVKLGEALLAEHNIRPMSFVEPVDDALPQLDQEQLAKVVCAVHSRAARRTVQFRTPAVVWDAAATETGDFWLWRIDFGKSLCMSCRFPDGDDPEQLEAKQLAEVVGLSEEVWYRKARDNAAFTAEEVAGIRAAAARGENPAWGFPAVGQPFGDWRADQCGKLNLPEVGDEEIPIPFAPVMAGVLVAGEVIKESLFPGDTLRGHYWNNLVGRFMPHNAPCTPSPREDCVICADPLMISQFRRNWPGQAAS